MSSDTRISDTESLRESLLKKFSPPLDSSLVLALLSDLEDVTNPPKEQVDSICATLAELALDAELSAEQLSFSDPTTTDDLETFSTSNTSPPASNASVPSELSSALGFLQAALPHIPIERLRGVINERGDVHDVEEIDMWEMIAGILTQESLREMEERGLDGLDDEDRVSINDDWETVLNKKPKSGVKAKARKQSKTKFAIADIRQQQQIHQQPPSASSSTSPFSSSPSTDPWTQIQSISSHLSTLLPPHPPSFFQPYFHSPTYLTPYLALCAALEAIVKAQSPSSTSSKPSSTPSPDAGSSPGLSYDPVSLITLLDILLPNTSLDPSSPSAVHHMHSRFVADVELALTATQGRCDDALDLMNLLQALAEDCDTGSLEMGVYHTGEAKSFRGNSQSQPTSPVARKANPTATVSLPDGPPPTPPPPQLNKTTASGSKTGNKPSPYQWQAVHSRKAPRRQQTYPKSSHVPTYDRDVNGMKTRPQIKTNIRGSGNGIGKGGKGDVGELSDRIQDSLRKRNEMLREASRMWQRGNKKTRGGEVALYFAERAREFQEMARKDSLDIARLTVESKRLSQGGDPNTIDLHGTTVVEGIQIAKETLQAMRCTSSNNLKIITGRGNHSAGQVSVLKPAVRKALVEDGWVVSSWDAGLIVKGKRG
ncbi:hypothetical protein PM082_010303 [Marasmius tenuissimus]|nr:hypothetical protein PM082_010303 [Marasmius tenuissimus]